LIVVTSGANTFAKQPLPISFSLKALAVADGQ